MRVLSRSTPRVSEADLRGYVAKGFTVQDSWRPRRLVVHDQTSLRTEGSTNRYHSGFREDLGLYVRSRWESNWGRYLTWLVNRQELERWEYEADTFEFPVKRGPARFYTPDYKLWVDSSSFYYQELKGALKPVDSTRLARMQKYYPALRVDLIREPAYRAVERLLGKIIPLWEWE